jgi:hypothetical protein
MLEFTGLVLGILLLICIAFFWWGSRRGFDITDEGFAFIGACDPYQLHGASLSCDRFYNHFLWKLVCEDVCSFRRLTIGIHMVAAMFLSFALVLSSSSEGSPFEKTAYDVNIVLFICLASASRYLFTRETANYNLYTSLCVTTVIGCFFLIKAIFLAASAFLPVAVLCLLTGCACGLLLFVKPTSSLILLTSFLFLILINYRSALAWAAIAVTLVGFVVWTLAHHFFIENVRVWLSNARSAMRTYRAAGMRFGSLKYFVSDIYEFANWMLRNVLCYSLAAWFLIMPLTAGVFGINLSERALVSILGGILLAVTIWTIFKRRLYLCYFYEMITTPSAMAYLALFNVSIIYMTAMVANGGFWSSFEQMNLAELFVLVFLPVFVVFGTGNPIFYVTNFGLISPYAVLVVVGERVDAVLHNHLVSCLVMVLCGGIATCHLFWSYIWRPYRIPRLTWQTFPVTFGPNVGRLFLDKDMAAFIRDVRSTLDREGFTANNSILAYESMPGLIFAVGGKSPVFPWLQDQIFRGGDGHVISRANISDLDLDTRRGCWIFLSRDSIGVEKFLKTLEELGLSLPGTHRLCLTLSNPWQENLRTEIWAPTTAQGV